MAVVTAGSAAEERGSEVCARLIAVTGAASVVDSRGSAVGAQLAVAALRAAGSGHGYGHGTGRSSGWCVGAFYSTPSAHVCVARKERTLGVSSTTISQLPFSTGWASSLKSLTSTSR